MTLKEIRSYLFSPALPAAVLLFGMVFCLAFTQFAGLRWQPSATITLYSGLLVWVAVLAWRWRKLWGGLGIIDALFGAFILWVLASLAIHVPPEAVAWRYGRYLPFLVIVPYVCGRLMRVRDVHLLSKIVAAAGLVMLILLAIDYWHNARNATAYYGYDRWPFFGHDYASLLIGALLAGALIVFYFRSLTGSADSSKPWLRRAADLAAMSLISVVLVWVAARGALLSGLLGIFCLTLILRRCSRFNRLMLILYLTGLLALSFQFLPHPQTLLYQRLITKPSATFLVESEKINTQQKDAPILGTASCRPFEEGLNSVAMRWVLYREAIAMFVDRPWRGVGAASFGRYSCTGVMGFPHSTILQAFAELGVIGGLLFVGLMLAAFVGFFRKAVEANATRATQAAQLALAWFMIYLVADQIYGNYFMAAGFYLLAGLAAGMRSNPVWNDGVEES
jgi:O-antigen ligase